MYYISGILNEKIQEEIYGYVVKLKTADILENEKDVWDMRKLDIVPRSNPIRGRYRLDFREIIKANW